jgi:hypothetical protein
LLNCANVVSTTPRPKKKKKGAVLNLSILSKMQPVIKRC